MNYENETAISGTAYIDNGPAVDCRLRLIQQMIDESTNLPQPDPNWEHVDSQGHWHAYDIYRKLPTLDAKLEQMPCDGSCGGVCEDEGYIVTHYYCRICREEITPGTVDGPHRITVPGRQDWRLEVDSLVQAELVSVRVETEGTTYFGMGHPVSSHAESTEYGIRATTTLASASPLGRRKSRTKIPVTERPPSAM